MIQFLLDTNAIIALIGRKYPTLIERIVDCQEGELAISSVVLHELYYGAYRSQKVSYNVETLRLLAKDFVILDFNPVDARTSGEIRSALASKGTPIGPYDVLIAGQAKARDLTLVTNNTNEFQRVGGLKIQDWTRS